MNILLSLALIVGTILRLVSLNQSFWLDEAAQATISRQGIFHINFIADFQPPLFYIITHFWQQIGISGEWFLRLVSVLSGVLTIYALYLIARKLVGERPALFAGVLLAVNPYHIYFSQEYRMYSFFAALVTLSWLLLLEKKWKSYTITAVALLYTHYFAGLVLIGQCIFGMLAKKKQPPLFYSIIFAMLAFFPWLPTLYKQYQTSKILISAWPEWSSIAGVAFVKFPFLLLAKFTVGMISPPKILYAIAFGIVSLITLYTLYHLYKNRSHTISKLIICWLIIPAGIAWIASIWIHANAPHRFVFLIPAFCVLFVSKKVQTQTFVIYLTVMIFTSFSLMYLSNPHYHREDWKGAVTYVDTRLQKDDLALTEFNGPWAPMDWYSEKPSHYIGASNSLVINQKTINAKLEKAIPCDLSLTTCDIYLFSYLFQLSDPSREVENYLLKNGYKLTEEKDFRGVGIVRKYSKNYSPFLK